VDEIPAMQSRQLTLKVNDKIEDCTKMLKSGESMQPPCGQVYYDVPHSFSTIALHVLKKAPGIST